MGAFLAHLWRIDDDGRLWRALQSNQIRALSLIENRFLYARFWGQGDAVVPTLKKEMRQLSSRRHPFRTNVATARSHHHNTCDFLGEAVDTCRPSVFVVEVSGLTSVSCPAERNHSLPVRAL